MTESPSFQLVDAMRTLQAALDHHDTAVSESQDLGRSDWRCLQILVNKGPQSPSVLQKRLGLTSGSVTALLDRLERRGLSTDNAISPIGGRFISCPPKRLSGWVRRRPIRLKA